MRITIEVDLDTKKLVKLLRLAASENDGEALNAMRAAQRLLRDTGLSWDWLIERTNIEEYEPTDDLPF